MTRNKAESQKRAKLLNKANKANEARKFALAAMRMQLDPVDPERLREINELVASIQPRDAESLQSEKPAVPKRTRNHKRDAWIYDQAMKGVPWNTINNGIPKRFPGYDSFADHSGVIRAAKRWAEKNGKPLPPLRR